MTKWRPPTQIRVKALGLHWRAGRLLAAEVRNDAGVIKGVRPLGGSVEFGESAKDAVVREFYEELGVDVSVLAGPTFFENIYVHEGAQGHEIVALFEVSFPGGVFGVDEMIIFQEDNGDKCVARWFDIDQLDLPGGPELYPTGLKAYLQGLQTR